MLEFLIIILIMLVLVPYNQLIYITEPVEVIANFSTIADTFFLDSNSSVEIHFKNNSSGSSFSIGIFVMAIFSN